MRTLLAVDGSDNSYEAVRALKYFARADQLIVLHVLDVPKPVHTLLAPEESRELSAAMEKTMREDGARLVDRIVSLLPMGVGSVITRMEVGSPAELIVSVAEEAQSDLLLMGARGLGPVKERLFGSVSHRVLTFAPCTTLILSEPLKALHHILLPLQGPYDAEAAVRFLARKPFREPVELTLMTVLPTTHPPWPVAPSAAETLEQEARQRGRDFLEDVASKLTGLGYSCRCVPVLGTPATEILHEAAKVTPDLILMGTHGRHGITRFVLGSVSHAVLHAGIHPVMVFR